MSRATPPFETHSGLADWQIRWMEDVRRELGDSLVKTLNSIIFPAQNIRIDDDEQVIKNRVFEIRGKLLVEGSLLVL